MGYAWSLTTSHYKVFCQIHYPYTKCTEEIPGCVLKVRRSFVGLRGASPSGLHMRDTIQTKASRLYVSPALLWDCYASSSFFSCTTLQLPGPRLGSKKCHIRITPNSAPRRFFMGSGPLQQFSATYFITTRLLSYKESIFYFSIR